MTSRPKIVGRKGVIAAGHHLAAAAGMKMLAKGGNAVDAGVAAGFALAVLKPTENSLGGECPILVYSPADQQVYSISGQGVAPGKATMQWFAERKINLIPGDGYLGATVPGLVGAYGLALLKFGRLSLKDVLEPAMSLAYDGYPIYRNMRDAIERNAVRYREEWTTTADVFMPGGHVPEVGWVVKQPALGHTFARLIGAEAAHKNEGREAAIQHGVDAFYKGEIADQILAFAHSFPVKDATGRAHTALLEKEDFEAYQTRFVQPVCASYRNYTVYKSGPWTQGPVFLQQLKLLEGFDLPHRKPNAPETIHLIVECAKLAYADREAYYGDPDFVEVPLQKLLSEAYNQEQRKRIDPDKANNTPTWEQTVCPPGIPDGARDTTHVDAVDDAGLMISAMPSGGWIPTSPVIPEVGFPLGTRGQMFSLRQGHPNCLAPGKRPRTTLTPSLAFRDGKPWMAFGTPGGDCQDQWALQFFLNVADFGMDLPEAIDSPSFHSKHFVGSFYPKDATIGTIFAEKDISLDVAMRLQDMGHTVHFLPERVNGQVCAVCTNTDSGMIEGAASPKYDGQAYAIGW